MSILSPRVTRSRGETVKSRLICLCTALAVLIGAMAFDVADASNGGNPRYHQHLEQPGEEALGPCTVCGGEGALCTHLPIIRIETGHQTIPGRPIVDEHGVAVSYTTTADGAEEIQVTVETVETVGVWHHADDPASQTARALFRIRGNSSRQFDKASYRIRLVEDGDTERGRSLPLLGMTAGDEWALHGPFLDKTLLRNYMWMNLSAEIMGYAPNVRFCEVILDGEYQGVYVLMETIREGEGRVDLTDYEPNSPVTSYMVRIEPYTNPAKALDNYTYYTYSMELNTRMEVIYPGASTLTPALKRYIQSDLSEIERGLYSADMLSGRYDYAGALDVDAFVDYYILQEFLAVNDAFSASTYFYRDVRGKLAIGPVWDYNNVLNNFFRPFSTDGFLLAQRGWYSRLMTDQDFVNQVIARYRQLRQGVLSEDYLEGYIDDVVAWLGSAVDRNDAVWGYSYDASQLPSTQRRTPDPGQTLAEVNPGSYREAVGWMKGYMIARGEWLDEHIDALLQHCQGSRTAAQRVE